MLPVYKNYAPSLYGPTSTVTVRRNLVPSPVNFSAGLELSRCTIAATGGVVTATVNAVGFMPRVLTLGAVRDQFPVTAGDQMTGSFKMHTSGVVYNMRMNWFSSPTVSVGTSAQFTQIGVAGQYFTQTVTVPAGAVYGQLEIGVADNTPISTQFAYSEPMFVVDTQRLPFWAVGLPSPDPDMEPAWAGTPESSPTLLQGQHPTAFTDSLCVSIVHEVGDGTRELRQIPTGAAGARDSFTSFAIPAGPLRSAGGTVLGALRLPTPLSGAIFTASSRRIMIYSPLTGSVQPPNTAGVHEQRIAYAAPLTSNYFARLYHGGGAGSGDAYWSEIGLHEGDYDGPWFDGNSGTVIIDGQPYDTSWASVPGSSPSLAILSEGGYSGSIYDTLYVFSTISNSWVRWQTPAAQGKRPVTLARVTSAPSAEAYTMRVSRRIFDEVRDLYTTPY